MGGGVGYHCGGIGSLECRVEEHFGAIEHDMLSRGYRMSDIGTDRLTYTEFRSLLAYLPPDGTSAYFRARYPNSWWWEPHYGILSGILFAAEGANWQRAGGKGEKPEMITRPKEAYELAREAADDDAVPLEDIRAVLASRKRPADG